ncbi:MAG TPA: ADP-ribosyltransferase [Saprospiraceae bacterium]|nr:ADP-ribosyltransferase [Saprospiraceae bacterium]
MSSFGPDGNIPLKISKDLSDLIRSHTKYVSNLSKFNQYLCWRYTYGSGAITGVLVGFATDEQIKHWVKDFFKLYPYHLSFIPKNFAKYKKYFKDPKSFTDKNDPNLGKEIINKYYEALQKIIFGAPESKGSFYVWKISNEYEGLPSKNLNEFIAKSVLQKPFNSTTYDPTLNLVGFTTPGSDCCLFRIKIPKGSSVLYIPEEFHAFPFERELLLPFNSTFDIKSSQRVYLNYIPRDKQPFVVVQDNPLSIGPVREEGQECYKDVVSKPITLFDTVFVN